MLYFTLMIFVKEGKEEVFHQFEKLSLPILEDYNGKLIYRLRPNKESFISAQEKLPYEIHFLSFNTENDFLNFTKDKKRNDFLHLKQESISSSLLIKGTKL
ncbi:hypothetical protein [Polaribacter sp. Asnod6-C07]|uniref:hypothetical protein n=1 Tax=Polaribacter sp. Asnod6-C07 TaxID=3160582 RepID=UPI00386D41E1